MLYVHATTALVVCTVVSSTALASTSFNTTTNDLGGGAYQLVDQFDILFSGETLYFDVFGKPMPFAYSDQKRSLVKRLYFNPKKPSTIQPITDALRDHTA